MLATFVFWDKLTPALRLHNIKIHDFLVLVTCAKNLDANNKVMISQRDISEDLKISPPNISTSIKKLVNAGILIKEGTKLQMNENYISTFIKNNAIASEIWLPV